MKNEEEKKKDDPRNSGAPAPGARSTPFVMTVLSHDTSVYFPGEKEQMSATGTVLA